VAFLLSAKPHIYWRYVKLEFAQLQRNSPPAEGLQGLQEGLEDKAIDVKLSKIQAARAQSLGQRHAPHLGDGNACNGDYIQHF
jgi:hypothetical protein